MQTYMVQITRADGSTVQRSGVHVDALAAAQIARATFLDAKAIDVETYSSWAAGQQPQATPARHDTAKLPRGGFYFAPGAVDLVEPRRWMPRDRLGRAVLQLCLVLVIAGLIGGAAGYLQVKGWPL